MKKAVVTGITGQDGAYLAQFLLDKGYEVYGTYRRSSSVNFWRIAELGIEHHPHLHLIPFDLTDLSSAIRMVSSVEPDEIYNLGAQSFVAVSFDQPILTTQVTGLGAVHLLEAIRIVNSKIKYYQAGTSEMFGASNGPQNEQTPFQPQSPYGIAKLYAHWMTVHYRDSYGIFAANGILFNHESPLRGRDFVTRKITDTVAKIKLGQADILTLGNLNAVRDWGYAAEYVGAMWQMLQTDKPDNFVLATGQGATVRDFTVMAFQEIGIDVVFDNTGDAETGRDAKTGKTIITIDKQYYRPNDVTHLIGDATKARDVLGWQAKTPLRDLCAMMVRADIARNEKGVSF